MLVELVPIVGRGVQTKRLHDGISNNVLLVEEALITQIELLEFDSSSVLR